MHMTSELRCGPETGLWEVKIGDGHLEVIWEDNGGRQQLTAISELTFPTTKWDALRASRGWLAIPAVF